MSLAVLFLIIAAVVGSTAMTAILTALILRTRRLEGGSPNDLRLLQNEVRRIAEELDSANGELERLRGRLDAGHLHAGSIGL